MPAIDALLVDFNGTVSRDEDVLFEIYEELCACHGRTLTHGEYIDEFVGRGDDEIFRRLLGRRVDVASLTRERVARYSSATAAGSTIAGEVRTAWPPTTLRIRSS